MSRCVPAAVAVALLVAAFAISPATSQTQEQAESCFKTVEQLYSGSGAPAIADQIINGCTAVIQSGRLTGKNLATTFFNRGVGYFNKKDYDRAINCGRARAIGRPHTGPPSQAVDALGRLFYEVGCYNAVVINVHQ